MSISVCMATYNGARYLMQQIDSILCQLNESDELVISDDGSDDATMDILQSYGDKRIKIFSNNNRHGVTGNFENALKHAQCSYIFLADQDDVWLEGRVKLFLAALQNADLVLSDCVVVDSELRVVSDSKFVSDDVRIGLFRNLYKSGYLGCCMAFRREVLEYVIPFPPKDVLHDIWIGLTVGIKGRFILLHQPTLLYRRHLGTVTHTNRDLVNNNFNLGSSKIFHNANCLAYKLKYRGVIFYRLIIWMFNMIYLKKAIIK